MIKTGIALSAGAVLFAGLAIPQAAVAKPKPLDATSVRNVKITVTPENCIRVKWDMPQVDSGDTFGVIIRSKNWAEFHRIETYKLETIKCGLKPKVYRVQVRQYGGSWVKSFAKVG